MLERTLDLARTLPLITLCVVQPDAPKNIIRIMDNTGNAQALTRNTSATSILLDTESYLLTPLLRLTSQILKFVFFILVIMLYLSFITCKSILSSRILLYLKTSRFIYHLGDISILPLTKSLEFWKIPSVLQYFKM